LTDATGGGVDDNQITSLDLTRFLQQVLSGHAFKEHSDHRLVRNPVRDGHELVSANVTPIGVGTYSGVHVGDAVTNADIPNIRTDGLNDAGCLMADARRQWQFVDALSLIDIEIVEANRRLADPNLFPIRWRQHSFLNLQNVGTTELANDNGVGFRHQIPFVPYKRKLIDRPQSYGQAFNSSSHVSRHGLRSARREVVG
jgi:hypothetical protein